MARPVPFELFNPNPVSDFCIIGGGISGLALARELGAAGASVVVVERGTAARGTGYVAAGMLAPLVEARLEERELLRFGHECLRAYPAFVAALESETGMSVDFRTEGTLIVALDRDDTELLRHQYQEQRELGLPVEWLSGYDCRKLEPCLAPGIPGGIFSGGDHQLDNRLLLRALRHACDLLPTVEIVENAGEGRFDEDLLAYRTADAVCSAGHFVIATGAYDDVLRQVEPALAGAVRPVKGQIIRLDQSAMPLLSHAVRTPEMYLAPKSSGMLVLGASSEDRGFDPSITAGELLELLRSAWECVPGIYELPVVETSVGFRPATVDHAPMLGDAGPGRVSLAMGYYRHGILFSPHAARVLADSLLGRGRSEWLDIFSPERFHATASERRIG